METDREVLLWFHARLSEIHGENQLYDYMHRLRWIILATPPHKTSRGKGVKKTCNSMQELGKLLKNPSPFEKMLTS